MKKFWTASILATWFLCTPSIFAVIINSNLEVTVESTASELTVDRGYFYSCQIRDIEHFFSLQSIPFSIPFSNTSEISDFACHGVVPFDWETIESSSLFAHIFFEPSCLAGSSSFVLTFHSIYAPEEEVQGYVADAQRGSLYGTLLDPGGVLSMFDLCGIDIPPEISSKNKTNKGIEKF